MKVELISKEEIEKTLDQIIECDQKQARRPLVEALKDDKADTEIIQRDLRKSLE